MAVLETIRNKFGILITVLIAVALLSFIIDPTSLSTLTGGQQMGEDIEVASINGKSVTYTDFNNEAQKLNPGDAMQNFLNRYLYIPTAQNAGFNVSEKEMYYLLSGNVAYPSSLIYYAFNGQMDPQRLIDMENNAETDESGRTKIFWENLKENVQAERYIQKYSEYLSKSLFSNSLLVKDNIKNANTFDVEFVKVPYTEVGSDIVVSEQEIADYYNAHKNHYPCAETRDLEYVVVEFNDENDEVVYAQVDSVFNNINSVEALRKAAIDNGFDIETINIPVISVDAATGTPMLTNKFGAIANVENIVKWAFKESSADVVSEIFTIENDENKYYIIAGLDKINPQGYQPIEKKRGEIEAALKKEKIADLMLAEVNAKVNGLTDLEEIAAALGYSVSTVKNMTFADADLDMKFTGAASVAQEGVVNAPFKGLNGIYVYKVTNRSEMSAYQDEQSMIDINRNRAYYDQMLGNILTKNVKDKTYLYF